MPTDSHSHVNPSYQLAASSHSEIARLMKYGDLEDSHSDDTPLNPALVETQDETTTLSNQHIPIWSPNWSQSNGGSQQQYSTTTNGGNYDWNDDVPIETPNWDPASQGVVQSLIDVTQGFQQPFIPALSLTEPLLEDFITNASSQPEPNIQSPNSGLYNGAFSNMPNGFADFTSTTLWGGLTAINHQDNMGGFAQLPIPATTVIPNGFVDFNPNTPWNDPTMVDPQSGMASFNQFPFPITTTSILATPVLALPTPADDTSTAFGGHRSIARRVMPPRSNVNTNAYSCDYTGCAKQFGRSGDLTRHKTKQHGPRQYPCLIPDCKYHGSKAFRRADKLRDHERNRHGMHT